MSTISLPKSLSPELVSLCINTSDTEQLVNKLAEDPLNLVAFFEAATSDTEWYQAHIGVSQRIISTISTLTPDNEKLHLGVIRICSLLLKTELLPSKYKFDILTYVFTKKIDSSMIPELTKLVIATKDEALTVSCLKLLKERYELDVSLDTLGDFTHVSILLGSSSFQNEVPKNVRTLISELGERLPIVFDFLSDLNNAKFQELILLCKGRLGILDLEDLGDSLTQDLLGACVENEPNLCSLSVSSKSVTDLDLKQLPLLSSVTMNDCHHLERISINTLETLSDLIVVDSLGFTSVHNESIKEVILHNLKSLKVLNLSNLNALRRLSVTSLPALTDITLPTQRPGLKDITVRDNSALSELDLSNLELEKLDLKGSFEKLSFSQTLFSNSCFDSFVEQLPTWTRLWEINLAGEMTQERFDRLVPHFKKLKKLELHRVTKPAGVKPPESLRIFVGVFS